jgi:hypothetical protein
MPDIQASDAEFSPRRLGHLLPDIIASSFPNILIDTGY